MKRVLSGLCGVALAAALIGTAPAMASSKASQQFKVTGTRGTATHTATINVAKLAAAQKSAPTASAAQKAMWAKASAKVNRQFNKGFGGPTPFDTAPWPIHDGAAQASQRFQALTSADSASVNGFDVQPPDQGMCVGQGKVLELINLATQVYSYDGTPQLRSPLALNTFFGVDSSVFTSDPQCYYDPGTNLWYATILTLTFEQDGDLRTSDILLAVSQNSDPTQAWDIFALNVINDGNTCVGGCLGDQPYLGMDGSGVYIDTNSFSWNSPDFNGTQLYVISKNGLLHGFGEYFHYDTFGAPFPGIGGNDQIYSLHATKSQLGTSTGVNNGTMYLLGTGDFHGGPGDVTDDVVLGAFTDTNGLNASNPVAPDLTIISFHPGLKYKQPVNAQQKAGKNPLGQQFNEPEGKVATNDDRMLQTWWDRHGHVWGAANTRLCVPVAGAPALPSCQNTAGFAPRVGVIYWEVRPAWVAGLLQGEALSDGYIAAGDQWAFFPAITYSNNGHVVIGMDVSGTKFFPSAAYADFTPGTTTQVNIYADGVNPEDGFCEYPEFGCGGPGVARPRYGDYSAAVALPTGNDVFLANEFIPADSFRDTFTNDGTFIGHIPTP